MITIVDDDVDYISSIWVQWLSLFGLCNKIKILQFKNEILPPKKNTLFIELPPFIDTDIEICIN